MLDTIFTLAQSAPPVELSIPRLRAALVGAGGGALLSFRQDLDAYLRRPDKTVGWDWGSTIARTLLGALTGFALAMGLLAAA